jgi:hypothetical protein
MPLPWQQHLTYLLSEFHQAYSHVTWPMYRVVPSRYEKLVDLDEEQLAEVGAMVEIDTDGEVVYRDRSGRIIEHPEQKSVLVSCLDPIPPPQPGPSAPGAPQPGPLPGLAASAPGAPQPGPLPGPVASAPPSSSSLEQPMIVEPDPLDTPPTGFPVPQVGPAPDQPFGPTGHQQGHGRRHW